MDANIFVAADADDAWCENGSNWQSAITAVELGAQSSGLTLDGYFSFAGVAIPQGAVIDSAVVRFVCATSKSGTNVILTILAEDADAPGTVTSCADKAGRAKTAATVAWNNPPSWTAGSEYDSPDISTVIQEIVDRPGWNSGNRINLFFDDNGSGVNRRRVAAAHEHASYNPAQLRITYTSPYTPRVMMI